MMCRTHEKCACRDVKERDLKTPLGRRRHWYRLVGGCVATLTIAAGATIGTAQAAEKPDGFAPVQAFDQAAADAMIDEFNRTGLVKGSEPPTARNDFASEAPDEAFELADSLREGYEDNAGYGAVQWEKETREIRVWWYGEAPSEVHQLATQTSDATGAPVTLAAMTYSTNDLAEAAQQILAAQKKAGGDDITSVTALHDGSGLEVAVSPSAEFRRLAVEKTTSDQLGTTKPFPVRVVTSGDVEPANSRVDQTAPYAGGARIYNSSDGSGCTSAFAVMITNPRPDRDKPRGMLTAHHCGNYGPGNWVTPSNNFYGYKTSEYANSHRDVAVVVNSDRWSGLPDSFPLYYPVMYVGAYNAGSRYVVVNGQTPVIGADWCTSGSYSGTHCYNEITQTNVYVDYGGPVSVGPLVETQNWKGINAVGQGDSGGPAYRYVNTTDNSIFATGIISGIRNASTSCNGMQYADRKCSATALISPIYPAMANMDGGLTLMTNTNY